ncbi:MAG: hypothetical protein Q8Q35_02890 [Nanoarchaeota archaeon]|nr:hypothetical protein [Nanoarchaeota archaeon]
MKTKNLTKIFGLTFFLILLLPFAFAVDTCDAYCQDESFESGVCTEASSADWCQDDETLTGSFDLCEEGSFERCCCSGEGTETTEEINNTVTEEVAVNERVSLQEICQKPSSELLFWFLLIVVVVLIILNYMKPKKRNKIFDEDIEDLI